VRSADPRAAPEPADAAGANQGEADLRNLVASPFVGATYRVGRLSLGLAYFTPFGGQSAWERNERFESVTRYPGAVDGVQRWYSIEGILRSSYPSAASAWSFGSVSAGLSVSAVETVASTLRARTEAGDDDVRNESRSWLDASGWAPSFGAGVTVEPLERTLRLGLSYQARPNLDGEVRARGHLRTVLPIGSRDDNAVDFHTNLPDIVRAGVTYQPSPEVALRAFGDVTRWSVLQDQCVTRRGARCDVRADGSAGPGVIQNQRRDWHDTFGVRLGASYWTSPDLELFVGGGFASNAVPDATLEPALPDWNTVSAAAGASALVAGRLRVTPTWTQILYLSRDTSGKSIHPDLLPPSRGPSSSGRYSQQLGVLDVNVDYAF